MITLGKKLNDTRGSISFEVIQTTNIFDTELKLVMGTHKYNRTTATHTFTCDDTVSDNDAIACFRGARPLVSEYRFYKEI